MFGCGDGDFEGRVSFAPALAQAAYASRADRLRHTDGLERDVLDWLVELRGRFGAFAASVLGGGGGSGAFGASVLGGGGGSGAFGASVLGGGGGGGSGRSGAFAASVLGGGRSGGSGAFAASLGGGAGGNAGRSGAFAASLGGGGGGGVGGSGRSGDARIGRVHLVPSTDETVRLGVFDSDAPDVLEIESGDVLVYPDTWSHFLNRMQPGVSIEELAQLRREHRGRGPHSIIGPVGVRGAQPGDMLEIEFQRLIPASWGATFVNPADLGTGTLPELFPTGQVKYLQFDLEHMQAEFAPGIHVPLRPFQGTVGVAPPSGGAVSSVPPGQHAGNIDLRDLTEGTLLYIPVWQAGAKLFTGDSHAAQGDGEVNNQAIESSMREVRLRVRLHQHADWVWPFAETNEHWIAMGIDADLNEAFRIATRNVIAFLERRAGLAPMDGYSLASIAVSFRVTQFVNQVRGVHAMIPKALFSADRRAAMAIV